MTTDAEVAAATPGADTAGGGTTGSGTAGTTDPSGPAGPDPTGAAGTTDPSGTAGPDPADPTGPDPAGTAGTDPTGTRSSTGRGRRRRELVLDAAESLFVTRGFHAVSVDDLGAAAGISGPGLYRHFSSKDAILMAVLDRIWRRLAPAVQAAEQEPPAAALDRLLDAHLDLALDHPAALELLFRELERLPEGYRERARRNHRRYVTAWADAIAALTTDDTEVTGEAAAAARREVTADAEAGRGPAVTANAEVVALAVHGVIDSATRHSALATPGDRSRRRRLLESSARAVLDAALDTGHA